jgi:hypothetical protein
VTQWVGEAEGGGDALAGKVGVSAGLAVLRSVAEGQPEGEGVLLGDGEGLCATLGVAVGVAKRVLGAGVGLTVPLPQGEGVRVPEAQCVAEAQREGKGLGEGEALCVALTVPVGVACCVLGAGEGVTEALPQAEGVVEGRVDWLRDAVTLTVGLAHALPVRGAEVAAGVGLRVPEAQALTDSVEVGLWLPLPLAHCVGLWVAEGRALCEGVAEGVQEVGAAVVPAAAQAPVQRQGRGAVRAGVGQ